MKRNIAAAKCSACAAAIAPRAGWIVPPAWRVFCDTCAKAGAGSVATSKRRVTLRQSGPSVSAGFPEPTPTAEDEFRLRIAARRCGGQYNPETRSWEVSLVQARELLDRLVEQDLGYVIEPDLVVALQSRAQQSERDRVQADERLAKIETEIATRGYKLLEYQREGVMWLSPRDAALMADGPGSGKSVQTICSIPDGAAVVVVCPASIIGVWIEEFKKWRPEFKTDRYNKKLGFIFPGPGEVIVVNYENTPGIIANAVSPAVLPPGMVAKPGTVLIADEAHRLKNPDTQTSKRFQALRREVMARGGRTWLLTGDPIKNKPDELYYVLAAAGLEGVFGAIDHYRALYGAVKINRQWTWGSPSPKVAETLKKVMLRRPEEQILAQLPRMTIQEIPVPVWSKAHRECEKAEALLSKLGVSLEDVMDRAFEKKNVRIAFEELAKIYAEMAMAKLPAAIELIEDLEAQDEPVVFFSAHKAPVEAIASRPGWAMIKGGVDPADRTRLVKEFQEGKLRGLAMTIQTGGFGITTTRACNAIFVDEAWTPTDNNQARKRLHRLGQGRQVFIQRLVADHEFDRKLIEIQDRKLRLIEDTVEMATVPGKAPEQIPMEMTQEKLEIEAKKKRAKKVKTEPEPEPVPPPPPAPETLFDMERPLAEAGDEITKKKAAKKKAKLTEVARVESAPEPSRGVASVGVVVDGVGRSCPEVIGSLVEARSMLCVPHWFDILKPDGSPLKPGDTVQDGMVMTTKSKRWR